MQPGRECDSMRLAVFIVSPNSVYLPRENRHAPSRHLPPPAIPLRCNSRAASKFNRRPVFKARSGIECKAVLWVELAMNEIGVSGVKAPLRT